MGGLEAIAEWLGARLFITNYRPVPLTEYAVFGKEVYRKREGCLEGYQDLGRDEVLEKVGLAMERECFGWGWQLSLVACYSLWNKWVVGGGVVDFWWRIGSGANTRTSIG